MLKLVHECEHCRFAGLQFTDGQLIEQIANRFLSRTAITFPTILQRRQFALLFVSKNLQKKLKRID